MADIRPIKILFYHPTHTFGGAERITYDLLNNLNIDEFEVTLLTSNKCLFIISNMKIKKIIYQEDLGIDNVWFSGLRSLFKGIKMLAILFRKERFDIAFGMMHYASILLSLTKRLYNLNVKIISSSHGPENIYFKKNIHSRKEKTVLMFLFYLTYHFSNVLVVPSHGLKNYIVSSYRVNRKKIIVINNSVNIDEIQQKSSEQIDIKIPTGVKVITSIGRLSNQKNYDLLLRAFREVRKDHKLILLIIGEGPEKTSLAKLAKQLKIQEDVYFLGFKHNPFKYLTVSDMFVHTSFFEGFGNVILEAMLCKIPVIATSCPYGPEEIINNGKNGILIPPDDIQSLVKAMLSLLSDENKRKKLSESGYERALDFPLKRMLNAYQDLFLNAFT